LLFDSLWYNIGEDEKSGSNIKQRDQEHFKKRKEGPDAATSTTHAGNPGK
jgi:hypothetical protein